jgi:hypothetical protein
MRVKASFVDPQLSKPRLCQRFGDFQPAPGHQLEAARTATLRYSPVPAIAPQDLWKEYEQSLDQARLQRQQAWSNYRDTASRERGQLKRKYRRQRSGIVTLPVSRRDRKRLLEQLALRQAIESRALKRTLAAQRKANQKTPHPGTWRHFVASRAASRDARAIRLLQRRERQQSRSDHERGM